MNAFVYKSCTVITLRVESQRINVQNCKSECFCAAFKKPTKATILGIHMNHKVNESVSGETSRYLGGVKVRIQRNIQPSLQVLPVLLPYNKSLIKQLLPGNQSCHKVKRSLYDV